MIWIALAGVVLMLVGTLKGVQPSARQTRIANLRESALKQGFHIKHPLSLKLVQGATRGDCVFYCINVNLRCCPETPLLIGRDKLSSYRRSKPKSEVVLLRALEKMSDEFPAIYLGNGLLGVSWKEEKTDGVLAELEHQLSQIKQLL